MAKELRGEVDAVLAGQTYRLRLSLGELEELENATGLGTLELLRSFGSNAKIGHAVAVLSQAIREDDKKIAPARVRRIVERAGFKDCVTACVNLLLAVLVDPNEGNADAAAPETDPAA
jgi:hypothetical protein